MNNITVFDFCREIGVPTVEYSANNETFQRWYDAGKPIVGLGTDPQYFYVEPYPGREEYVTVRDGRIHYGTIDFKELDINILFLVSKLFTDLNLTDYNLYFYVVNDYILISGVE